jgi:hypothetical protein
VGGWKRWLLWRRTGWHDCNNDDEKEMLLSIHVSERRLNVKERERERKKECFSLLTSE